mgnify:CR=1 FL=1
MRAEGSAATTIPSAQQKEITGDMSGASKSLKNARDTILDAYLARPGCKTTREELAALMDKDIFITPTQAKEYGLIDEIVTLEGVTEPEGDPAAFCSGGRPHPPDRGHAGTVPAPCGGEPGGRRARL